MERKAKKSYKRPEVFKVGLTPDEAVLTGCKRGGVTGKPEYGDRCSGKCASTIAS